MRILGADLSREETAAAAVNALVFLDDRGRVHRVEFPATLPEAAALVGELPLGEPFLLGVNLPVVSTAKAGRSRPVDNLMRRRLGYRPPRPARGVPPRDRSMGETLLAALAAAGHPCLPYPDRDRRTSGLAEVKPGLTLKALLWERSPLSRSGDPETREARFRGYTLPPYRVAAGRARGSWADRAAALDLVLRALEPVEGYDLAPVLEALAAVASDEDTARAAALMDAVLVAGTAKRYLNAPENCLFLGNRESGYVILPADGFIRRLAIREGQPAARGLFPKASLRQRLAPAAELHPLDLLEVPGRGQRQEATFREFPVYEFDNVDEMLWWKHCRHVAGPVLPTEGLQEMTVRLDREDQGDKARETLRLVRSRHRTLSFRFDPPAAWRRRVPTRDGNIYPFRILRATYETR